MGKDTVRMIPRLLIIQIVLAAPLGVSGCASVVNEIAGQDLGAVTRGRHFAEKRCATCHSISVDGTSPRSDAPNFGQIKQDYKPGGLGWELEASSEVGHYGMPPTSTTAPERRDLVAYVESLHPR
jgi:mono/diheme cytochrome c family protein